jgi:hypothetical protein
MSWPTPQRAGTRNRRNGKFSTYSIKATVAMTVVPKTSNLHGRWTGAKRLASTAST